MNVEKVMEILAQFESQAVREIKLDKAIDTDNYESVGKFKLIGKIKKHYAVMRGIAQNKSMPHCHRLLHPVNTYNMRPLVLVYPARN